MTDCPVNGPRARLLPALIVPDGRDLETRVRQSLNDAFRDLLGFLRTHRLVRAIFPGIAKCGCNDRNGLMWIGQSALPGLHGQGLPSLAESRALRPGRYPDRAAEASANYGLLGVAKATAACRPGSKSLSPNIPNPVPTAAPVRTGNIPL